MSRYYEDWCGDFGVTDTLTKKWRDGTASVQLMNEMAAEIERLKDRLRRSHQVSPAEINKMRRNHE